jgi:hypothetical protein
MAEERYQDDQGTIIGAPNGGGRALEALGYTRIDDGDVPPAPVVIPEGEPTEQWTIAALKAYATREELDLLTEFSIVLVASADDDEEPAGETVIPDGLPDQGWKVGEIKAYAVREGIELGDAKNKGEYLAAIAAAKPAE